MFNIWKLSVIIDVMEYCLENGCKVANRKEDKDMIKCIMCMKWHHDKCVDIKKDDPLGAWTCYKCRKVSTNVDKLTDAVSNLTTLVERMSTLLEKTDLEYKDEINKLKEENTKLTTEVKRLQTDGCKQTTNDLLLGSSQVKNISPKLLNRTEVASISGGTINDAKKR